MATYAQLLVPIDFSQHSARAAARARALAEAQGGSHWRPTFAARLNKSVPFFGALSRPAYRQNQGKTLCSSAGNRTRAFTLDSESAATAFPASVA